MQATSVQYIGTALFGLAVIHTFSTGQFQRLAQAHPRHAGLWHLLGEVEVVFGFWSLVLMGVIVVLEGQASAVSYLESRNFTEPLFVFAVMVMAGTRAVLQAARAVAGCVARLLPFPRAVADYMVALSVVPLLGSFITEPAAMTLAALMLRERFMLPSASSRLKYCTLGVLFVNVSIGGVLTPFAAPPVLMVASTWGWDTHFMLTQFGWKAVLAVGINALAASLLMRRELSALDDGGTVVLPDRVPVTLVWVHLLLLCGVVTFAHHPVVFLGLFLLFLGVTEAYEPFQDRLLLREGLLVAFFLAGLVVMGGQQRWWLQPLLTALSADAVYWGAVALTALTDNAALTYLGSQVPGLADAFKYALVAGAVTGGGLTIIANAPNPAGLAIVKDSFVGGTIHPLNLLAAAAFPTLVAALAFRLL